MKIHKVLYKICSTEKEANKDLCKVINKYPTAFVEMSDITGHWLIYLYASKNKSEVDECMKLCRKEKLQVFYQYN